MFSDLHEGDPDAVTSVPLSTRMVRHLVDRHDNVHLADNILQHYSIERKLYGAHRRILYHGIKLCVHNAHIMECFVEPGQD